MDVVKKKVGSENFDLVFDKGGLSFSQVPIVLYSRDNMEFSEEIIRTLNKNKPADSPAASPASGATPASPAASKAPAGAAGATPGPARRRPRQLAPQALTRTASTPAGSPELSTRLPSRQAQGPRCNTLELGPAAFRGPR